MYRPPGEPDLRRRLLGEGIMWLRLLSIVGSLSCLQAERDEDLSLNAIPRRRVEICDQALRKLVDFKPYEIAEKALNENYRCVGKLEQSQSRASANAAELEAGVSRPTGGHWGHATNGAGSM